MPLLAYLELQTLFFLLFFNFYTKGLAGALMLYFVWQLMPSLLSIWATKRMFTTQEL
jgi:hypothetical protein